MSAANDAAQAPRRILALVRPKLLDAGEMDALHALAERLGPERFALTVSRLDVRAGDLVVARHTAWPWPLELALDQWLARLLCPAGGVVVVPFAGTGSEVIAALEVGARVIAIELEPDHVEIQCARLAAWGRGDKDIEPTARPTRRPRGAPAPPRVTSPAAPEGPPQLPLTGLR